MHRKKYLIILLFAVFLVLRLFVRSPFVLLGSDHIKYLELAKNFPYHTITNNQLYIDHGPLYPYVIHFFTIFFRNDYIASIMVSVLSAIVTFFLLYKLFILLFKNFYVAFTTLILFTLSVEFIMASKTPLKESFMVMLIFLAIYFYIRAVKFYDAKSLLYSSIFGAALAFTADHVIFLFPTFVLSYIFFNHERIELKRFHFPHLKYALIPFIVTLLAYGSWLGIKDYQYSHNQYYPAGLEGAPVSTKNYGITQLLNPVYFEGYDPNFQHGINTKLRHYAFGIGYMFNTEPFSIPLGLNLTTMKYLLFPRHIAYMIFFYLPLAIFAASGFFFTIKNYARTKRIYNNYNLYLILVFLIFIFPLTQVISSPRYIYTDYAILYYFIGFGIFMLLKKMNALEIYKRIIPLIAILLVLLIPIWIYYNHYFVFFTKKNIELQRTADYINTNLNKNDGIMAQAGYTYKLPYLTPNRVLGLPPNSENLMPLIRYYNITYVIFGKYYTVNKYQYSKDAVEFIKNNPDKFKLVAAVKEDYNYFYAKDNGANTDEVYIYQVS